MAGNYNSKMATTIVGMMRILRATISLNNNNNHSRIDEEGAEAQLETLENTIAIANNRVVITAEVAERIIEVAVAARITKQIRPSSNLTIPRPMVLEAIAMGVVVDAVDAARDTREAIIIFTEQTNVTKTKEYKQPPV